MIRKKSGRVAIILRLYFVIVFCFVSFFTIYAYRYNVLDFFNAKGAVNFNVTEKTKTEIREEFKLFKKSKQSENLMREYLQTKLPDYGFSAYFKDDEGQWYYMLASNGGDPLGDKRTAKYISELEVQIRDQECNLYFQPKFTNYLEWYRTASICFSVVLSIILFLLLSLEYKRGYFNRWSKRLYRLKPLKWITKLSLKITIINIIAVVIALSSFYFMFQNRYSFLEFAKDNVVSPYDYKDSIKKIENEAKNLSFHKKDRQAVINILDKYSSSTNEIHLYEENGRYFTSASATQRQQGQSLYIRGSVYDVNAVAIPRVYNYPIKLGNQTGEIMIYSYPVTDLVIPYMICIVFIAFSFYLIISLLFMNKKVKEIESIKEDILILASGEWNHQVNVLSNDEIAQLGDNLNQMRISFLENKMVEEAARKGNKDLIASMSHDLRTPLTSLLGYLDIIRLKKYKSQEQYESYLNLCVDKVNQINDLSNKTFEYALVFESSEEFSTEKVALSDIEIYLKDNIHFLKLEGYNIDLNIVSGNLNMNVNMAMIKRIINNLISNVSKYADPNKKIIISMSIQKECLSLSFSNTKILNKDIVESNRIGLKSVTRMVELHQGEIYINDDETNFMVVINIPVSQD